MWQERKNPIGPAASAQVEGSLSEGWGCPDCFHAFAPFQIGKISFRNMRRKQCSFRFSGLRHQFASKVRAFRECHPVLVVRSDVGHPSDFS